MVVEALNVECFSRGCVLTFSLSRVETIVAGTFEGLNNDSPGKEIIHTVTNFFASRNRVTKTHRIIVLQFERNMKASNESIYIKYVC